MVTWSLLEIGGKPADVREPEGQPPRFAVIYLHSFLGESLRNNDVFTRLLDEAQLACIGPQGKRCWWVDRVCAEFDATLTPERYIVDVVVPWARQRWGLGPRGLGLLGVDMGGQGALRLALKHPETFPVVAAIAPSIEYHELYWSGTPIDDLYASKEECRQDTAPMHLHPTQFPPHIFFACDPGDPWWRGCDRLHEKMAALGVSHECDLQTRGGGHTWEYFNRQASRAVHFLSAGLERESRRLI